MLSVDDELAQQEALLNEDVPNAPAAGAPEALADPAGDDDVDVDDDAGEEHFRRRANQPAGTEGTDAGMEEQTAEAGMDVEDGVPRVGQRKIIRRTLEPDGTVAAAGIDPTDPEELKRREARAEKFGLSEEQKVSKKREERMKKFGLDEPEPEPPAAPAMPLVNKDELAVLQERARRFEMQQPDPLEVIELRAGAKAYWEKRRTAASTETPRPESIYVYGTDKMSTNELLLLFMTHSPQWVEWINDSSANVVFESGAAASAALEGATVALWSAQEDESMITDGAPGPDGGVRDPEAVRAMLSWRTLPDERSAAGKGLQLLFRLSSEQDHKPEVRKPSRWYGETERSRRGRGGRGGRGAGRSARALRPSEPRKLLVALGTPPPDLRTKLGKRTEREPPSAADGADGDAPMDGARDGAPAAAASLDPARADEGDQPAPAAKRRATGVSVFERLGKRPAAAEPAGAEGAAAAGGGDASGSGADDAMADAAAPGGTFSYEQARLEMDGGGGNANPIAGAGADGAEGGTPTQPSDLLLSAVEGAGDAGTMLAEPQPATGGAADIAADEP